MHLTQMCGHTRIVVCLSAAVLGSRRVFFRFSLPFSSSVFSFCLRFLYVVFRPRPYPRFSLLFPALKPATPCDFHKMHPIRNTWNQNTRDYSRKIGVYVRECRSQVKDKHYCRGCYSAEQKVKPNSGCNCRVSIPDTARALWRERTRLVGAMTRPETATNRRPCRPEPGRRYTSKVEFECKGGSEAAAGVAAAAAVL